MIYIKNLVSIIIPTYKRSNKLKRAIESVLAQSYRYIELIIVNDNVPNDEYSIMVYDTIKQFNDTRLLLLEQEKHTNGAVARNCGIKKAKGEYIAFLDDDDYWEIEKIEKQVFYLAKQSSNCGAVSTLLKYVKNGTIIRLSNPYKEGRIFKEILRRQIDVTTCSLLIKHSVLDETGYFDETLKRHQEIQLLVFLTYKYELKLIKQYLTCIDITDNENNPNSLKINDIKRDFFSSVKPIMDSLPVSEQKRIIALHSLEIAIVNFRERHFKSSLIYFLKIFRDPKTLWIALIRIVTRIWELKGFKKRRANLEILEHK